MALRQFKSVTNRAAKLAFIVPMSLARFALIKPLMDTVFKGKSSNDGVEVITGVRTDDEERKIDKWA